MLHLKTNNSRLRLRIGVNPKGASEDLNLRARTTSNSVSEESYLQEAHVGGIKVT